MSEKNNLTEKIKKLSVQDTDVKLENKNNFNIICIKPNDISSFDYNDPAYLKNIFTLNNYKELPINPEKFTEDIGNFLDIKKHDEIEAKIQFISEDTEHVYEMLYVDIPKEKQKKEIENQLASLINTNGDNIYGNAIILKTHLPLNSNNMCFQDITVEDLQRLLFYRANNIIVTYNDELWKENTVSGDINIFADNFFGEDKYRIKKKEIAFLMHNINIWYTTFEYAEEKICGNVINDKIDKCFWFSKMTDIYRTNLKLDEVKKIIKLSEVLESYEPSKELMKDEIDNIGRKIVKNKYRILNKVYLNYFG
jgi:hypothetical protein